MRLDDSELHTLNRSGSALHYWTTGHAGAPVVVFNHGATLDHTSFDPQIEPIASAGYRAVTWDLRGHGASQPIGERFDVRIAADDLIAILDDLGEASATLVGHSFGGYVVQQATFRYPDRVDAVVIIGCTDLSIPPPWGMRIAARVLPRILPLFPVSSFRKRTVQDLSLNEKIKQRAYDATGRLAKPRFTQIILAGVECLGVDAGYGSGYTIPKPLLLTHGDSDRANRGVFAKAAPAWAAREPNCTYVPVRNAGHTANQDNAEAFNQILLKFLTREIGGYAAS